MEQEKSMYQLKNAGKLTGELLVKGLLLFWEKGEGVVDLVKNRPTVGEQKWNSFMATGAKKEIKEFRTTEANLEQLRSVLKLYDVRFSIKSLDNEGTTLLSFEAKNREFMEKAFEKVIERATNPETSAQFGELLASKVEKQTFEQRLANATKQSEALQQLQETKVEAVSKVTQKMDEVTK
ncbi:DUF3801 domain-containing protein [Streptococcus suis]|uniref:DUF3801 domain-containing protein n=1 Tax=Streptococcus suis TaxID=1307 RepID=UPI0037572A4D